MKERAKHKPRKELSEKHNTNQAFREIKRNPLFISL
jgi:hypothetical protein